MAGYAQDFSMSNNALAAYDAGLVPASKVDKRIPASLIEAHCRYAEWHHSSSRFNRVKFYDPAYVRARFGVEVSDEYEPDAAAVAALAAHKANGKSALAVYENCTVNWIEWGGSIKRPKAYPQSETGCIVSVKGATATITLPSGKQFIKRLSTNGFSFKVAG